MKKEVQAVLLILVGGAVARIALSGAYLNYVKSGMKPYLLVSAAVLLALGAMALVDAVRKPGKTPSDVAQHAHDAVLVSGAEHASAGHEAIAVSGNDDGHDHGSMRAAWLLLLPVAAIFLIAPGPLGAYTASRQTSSVTAPSSGIEFDPLPAGDPVAVPLDDFATRAIWDDGRTLAGRTVDLVGFVTPTSDGQWQLTRMSLTCCAADAVTVKVQPKGDVAPLPANTWVNVTGTYEAGGGTQSSTAIPWVKVKEVTKIQQPADPYL